MKYWAYFSFLGSDRSQNNLCKIVQFIDELNKRKGKMWTSNSSKLFWRKAKITRILVSGSGWMCEGLHSGEKWKAQVDAIKKQNVVMAKGRILGWRNMFIETLAHREIYPRRFPNFSTTKTGNGQTFFFYYNCLITPFVRPNKMNLLQSLSQ